MSTANEAPQQSAALERQLPIEELRYREELANKIGLPSPYGMKLLKDTCADLVASGFAPACFGKNPSALFLAAMRGAEMGLKPTESIMETFWASPQNRLGMYANKMLEIMHKNGVRSKFTKETAEECEIIFTPPSGHEPYTSTFSIEEARNAGLVKKDSNWDKWPKAMNRSRAISIGWRAINGTFGIAGANVYTPDEIQDIEATEPQGTVTVEATTEVKAGTKPKAAKTEVMDAKAESVKTATPSAFSDPPDTAPVAGSATPRTVSRTDFGIYSEDGDHKPEKYFDTLDAANTAATARTTTTRSAYIIERLIQYSDATMEKAVVAKVDPPEAEPVPEAAAPVTQAEPEKPPVNEALEALKARAVSIRASLPGKDEASRKAVFEKFGNGFFGVAVPREWPRNITERTAMLDALELSLERQTDRDFVVTSPKRAGEQAKLRGSVQADPVYGKLGWSAETIAVSREFRKVWVLDQDEDFMAYVSHFLKVEEPDAYAYMRMAIVSGRGSETLKLLRDASTELAEPYGAIIGSLVKYVGELKSENLKAIEAGLRKMIEHNKTPAAAAAEPEKSAPPVDDDDGWS